MTERKEEVVISGIGGMFPECDNVDELKDLLFNKINGVTIDSRRWSPNAMGAIDGTGKLKNIDKFDATFFSAHPKLAEITDPLTRVCLERSIEAIIDAGLSPLDLYGTNTAVFTGSAISVSEMYTMDCVKNSGFSMLGRSKTMQANRVSYILNLTGPSFSVDGGWICGANGLERAKQMIEDGIVSAAIVGVTGLILKPEIQFQFQGLNRLNRDIQTKPFSSDADGYNRSEACVVMLLQRASEAKRSYGTLLSVKSKQFGDHQGHLSEHMGHHYKSILLESYEEANIDPSQVEYIEAYGSGIKCEDTMELNVLEEVFCTAQRKTPLKVGSVKSNVGHCEAASQFVSIVKAIIALDTGYIPPNINYAEPNENVPALKTGNIQIVTEKTALVGDIVGISSFGILNAFSHVILKRNEKVKNISDNDTECVPRLIVASGRTEDNARAAVQKIMSNGNDAEYVALTNHVFTKNINAHFYRCFSIFPCLDETRINDVWNVSLQKRPVWFIFSGMGSQWQGMGAQLMQLPVFAEAINKCDSILKPRGIDIKHVLTSLDPKLFDNILNSFVGIAAVQIGLVEVLRALDVNPDGMIGHSVGELGCAYADGCFTAEEMILSAYARGRASIETDLIPGMMAAVGLGYDEIKDKLPRDVDVACRNSASSCTISGPVDSINEFVTKLKSEGIFAKAVNVASIAFHSRYIQSAGPTLLKYLKEVIKEPKLRSSKWISSSIPESKWDSDLAKYSSPEYHTNNLLNSVLFEDALKHIPNDAVTIEIAPHGLLQAILIGALPDTVTNVPLTKRIFGDSTRYLLSAIGKMYTSGINPKINGIYPTVEFPVSRGTPALPSLPLWDHNDQWTPTVARDAFIHGFSGERMSTILLNDDIHLIEYQIHGHHIIPISYILIEVWKMFTEVNAKKFSEEPIQFQNLRFKNNVKIHPTNPSESYLMIQWGSGLFEYTFGNDVILSGQISFMQDTELIFKTEKSIRFDTTSDDFHGSVSKDELYNILEKNGYKLGDGFKNILSCDVYKNNIQGIVKWANDWVYFLDGLFKLTLFVNLEICNIETPVSVRQIRISPMIIENSTEKDVYVNYNTVTNEITCNGVEISDVKNGPIMISKFKSAMVKLEEQTFVNLNDLKCKNVHEFIYDSMGIIMEADKLGLDTADQKFILCNFPLRSRDPMYEECLNAIKQAAEDHRSINCTTLSWDNIKNISEDDESRRLVTFTDFDCLQDTTKDLANTKHSYVIVCSKQSVQDFRDWKLITQQKFDDDNYLSLMKKKIVLDGNNCIFINRTNDNYDSSVWNTLEKYKSSDKIIYIISEKESIENVNSQVKDILEKYKSQAIRFLFILDSDAPEFKSNKSLYMDHLSLGLIINIYKNGGWGMYKRIVLQNLKSDIMVTGNPVLENLTTNNKSHLTIKYLGLNSKDLVVEDNTENSLGPLEYSGTIENNNTVFGITSFEQTSFQIQYDSLLSWPVPSTFTLEDAATVPLSYAMSYYVFNVLSSLRSDMSILVSSGLHPIGRAAIAICLVEKCETYAIVESNQQAEQLSHVFPELPRSRIIVNTNDKFDIVLRMMTKSKGIDLILNFLSGDAFHAAFRALADHGKFFQFSKSDMKKQGNIGTRVFLRNTSFTVVSSKMLLNESAHNKQIVQRAFAVGLDTGVIKPFDRTVVTTPFNIDPISDALRKSSITSHKLLLRLNDDVGKSKDNFERNSYQCNPDHVYVIVGHKSEWLELVEWLVNRGAQKIVISVKRCLMSSTNCRRFDRLISRNVSIQIESDLYLNTKDDSLNWLNRITASLSLGSIFLVHQFDDNKINNIRYAFEENSNKSITTSFICISSKGEHVCSKLKSIGLNAFNVSWDGMSKEARVTEKILTSLDTLMQKSPTTSTTFVCSELDTKKSEWSNQMNGIIVNFFPESMDELHLFSDKIAEEADFVEVPTMSPRFSRLKSVIPVFVIPGFRPRPIRTLYSKLFYPVFEAQLPEDISSIDELSETLVNKLRQITDKGYVSLIGDCWGGIVALRMAQILEAQGTLVTVSLLEGDPEFVSGWAERFLANDNLTKKLYNLFSSLSNDASAPAPQQSRIDVKPSNTAYPASGVSVENKTDRAIRAIRSRLLHALSKPRPLLKKLQTKILVFRYERTFEFYKSNLNDYCLNPPFVHIISQKDYKSMVVNKETVEAITKNVAPLYPVGIELSLSDKYKNYYFNTEKLLKHLN